MLLLTGTHSKNTLKPRRGQGFTLIEVLVAMAITAVLGVIAYTAIATAIKANESSVRQMEQLRQVAGVINRLSRDIRQVVNRSVRNEFDEHESALAGGLDEEQLLTLTRSGWQTFSGKRRSQLQRVNYYWQDDALWRSSWSVLDRSVDSEPADYQLLDKVDNIEIQFLAMWPAQGNASARTEWQDQWDSADQPDNALAFPIAVEIGITVQGLGKIVRLLEITINESQPGGTGE
jgi:general secretion pathway protein J